MSKIFCLGLHKTGTLSLARALGELGYRVRHGYKKQSDLILDALYDKTEPLKYIEEAVGEHDAYADLYAVRWFFPKLVDAYPGSKFILTTRDENKWLDSVHRQIKKRPDSPFFHYWYYQTNAQRREDKRSSEKIIREYFAGSSNLLEIDLTQGEGPEQWKWDVLCNFLDEPVPDKPFPHANKSPKL